MAHEEIRVINETINIMSERKSALEVERAIAEVGQQLEQDDDVSGVIVNSMDFICMW
jgi:hypothetical protein